MKLPLSQAENEEIAASYAKAKDAADKLAGSMTELLETLTQRMAHLDKETRKALDGALEKSMSTLFKVKMQEIRVGNLNLEGREFKPGTTEQSSNQNQP